MVTYPKSYPLTELSQLPSYGSKDSNYYLIQKDFCGLTKWHLGERANKETEFMKWPVDARTS